jgi:hypothetical protein
MDRKNGRVGEGEKGGQIALQLAVQNSAKSPHKISGIA